MVNFSTKIASTVSVVALTVTALGATVVSAASEFLPYAELLVDNSVINSQSTEAGYRLGDTITRAELAKVAANLGGYTPTSCTGVYTDVGAGLGDLCGYIEALNEDGVVASATNFRPLASVTRAEMVKMLLGVVGETGSSTDAGYMDVAGLGDLTGFVNRANEMGCAATATYFRPNATASRGEAFKIAACAAGLEPVTPPVDNGSGTTTTSGSVSVALDGTAVAQYVPYNASSVKVGSIKLTAGAADTTVSSVVVTRSGLGNVQGIASLQLAQNGVAVSDTRTMSTSSQTSTLRFTTPLVLAAGTSASFDILVNLNGSSTDYQNNQHQFTVTGVNVVNGSASGTPVTLGLLNTTSYSVGTVTINSLSAGTVTSGKVNQTVATVNVGANRDGTINGFTLTRSSGEDFTKVLANVTAYYNGTAIGTVTVSTDKIVVTGLNIARLSGESASIEIRADGIYVGSASNVDFNIAQSTDVSATEKATGYIMGVTGAPSATASLTLGALDITLTKVSTGSKTVAPGTSSVELYNATIKSDASFDISNFTVTLNTTSGTGTIADFSDAQVVVWVAGSDYIMDTASKTFSQSSDAFRVEPGTPVTVRVVANVKSTATVPTVYNVNLTLNTAKNISSGQYVTLTGKNLTGDSTTVSNGTYTVEKPSSIPTNKTLAEGSQSDAVYFNVRAAAEDQVLKSLTVTSGTGFDVYATKVALMQGSTELKSITSSTDLANTSYVFTDINQTLNKDVTTPFTIRVTLKSGEVESLGTSVNLAVDAFNVVRSVDQTKVTTTSSTLPLAGNTYQVSSTTPVVSLPSQTGVDTEIVFANTSPYDVVLESVTTTITQNSVNGSYLAWNTSAVDFLDAINGSMVGSASGTAPGQIVFTPTSLTIGTASVSRFLEVQNNTQTITDADYTVTVKSITYHYVDRTDSMKVSPPITESVSGVSR